MEKAGIIELAEYREVGGGAPEKVWKLKTKEIRINLLKDLPEVPWNDYEKRCWSRRFDKEVWWINCCGPH